jgi:hypothetical protein
MVFKKSTKRAEAPYLHEEIVIYLYNIKQRQFKVEAEIPFLCHSLKLMDEIEDEIEGYKLQWSS